MMDNSEFPSLEALGRPDAILEVIDRKKAGIILVSGGPYSGKTTTIVSLAHELKARNLDVLYVQLQEVETLPGLDSISNQAVNDELLDYLAGDGRPDVLVLHDVKDPALYQLAFQVASAGSLVIVGLLAKSSEEAVFNFLEGLPDASERKLEENFRDHIIISVYQRFRALVSAYTLSPEFIAQIKAINESKDIFVEEGSKKYYTREKGPRFKLEYQFTVY